MVCEVFSRILATRRKWESRQASNPIIRPLDFDAMLGLTGPQKFLKGFGGFPGQTPLMNTVTLHHRIPSPPSNCDRYGHPLRDATPAFLDGVLERYLSEMEEKVTERWSQLYRKLYDERGASVPQEELVTVIQATLRGLCQGGTLEEAPTFSEGLRRQVQRRVCLAGWECHGYLVPTNDWKDQEDLAAIRGALKRKLLVLLDRLIA